MSDRTLPLRELAEQGGWASTIATEALTIEKQFRDGELSADEAKELLEDLARLEGVVEASSDIKTKALLVEAIMGVAAIV